VVVRRRPKPLLFLILFLVIIGISLIAMAGLCIFLATPVDNTDDTKIEVVIPQGVAGKKIASILKEKDLIRNELYFSIYIKTTGQKSLKASTYELSKNMSLKEIVKTLEDGNNYDPDEIAITFKEGENIPAMLKLLQKKLIIVVKK